MPSGMKETVVRKAALARLTPNSPIMTGSSGWGAYNAERVSTVVRMITGMAGNLGEKRSNGNAAQDSARRCPSQGKFPAAGWIRGQSSGKVPWVWLVGAAPESWGKDDKEQRTLTTLKFFSGPFPRGSIRIRDHDD